MNDTLDDLNRSAWNLYNLVNGNTYKGRMDDVKKDIVILLENLGHNVWEYNSKIICNGGTTPRSPWKLKTEN